MEEVYSARLPRIIKRLLLDRARDAVRTTELETALENSITDRSQLRDELEEAHVQLLVANTSVSTLQGVIRDHRCTVHRSD